MPLSIRTRGPVLYASWRGFTLDDLRVVTERLAGVRRTSGKGAVYLSRIPADARIFTAEECAVLLEFLVRILPSCASIHHVIEGDGFIKSARRATVTNMALSTPRPRDFYTHDTVAEALGKISVLHSVDVSDLVARVSAPGPIPIVPKRRASAAFRDAVRIAEARRPPRKP